MNDQINLSNTQVSNFKSVWLELLKKKISINYKDLFVDLWYWGQKTKDKFAVDYYGIKKKIKKEK